MHHPALLRRFLPLGLLWASALSAQGSTWTVDDDDPGAHFDTLQAAVDAAAPGDLVLVRGGTYFSAELGAKGLTMAAEAGAQVWIRHGLRSTGLAAGEELVLQGLTLEGAPALELVDAEGTVVVDRCTVTGHAPFASTPSAAVVRHCADVVFLGSPLNQTPFGSGQSALVGEESHIVLYGSDALGTDGAPGLLGTGNPGQTGVELAGGSLFASGARLVGGDGADGTSASTWFPCGDGGDGAPGLILGPGPATQASATLLDCEITGGAGGSALPGCQPGVGSEALVDPADGLSVLDGAARGLVLNSPLAAGATLKVSAAGKPGDLVVLAFGLHAAPAAIPAWQGELLPGVVGSVLLGSIPAGGELGFSTTAGLAPGASFGRLFVQAVHVEPTGKPVLGSAAVSLVLAP